jgi:aminoglycoside 3-N-acetyltransferase
MNNVLYIRAGLKGVALAKNRILSEIQSRFSVDEILVPAFTGARPIFRKRSERRYVNSAISKILLKTPGTITSAHPSHQFTGTSGLAYILAEHDYRKSCFWPIKRLAETTDSGMLLLGCLDESPGFSTVHAVQEEYGLTKKHLVRFLYRWDIGPNQKSIVAPEIPGCSLSFDKFYKFYQEAGILESGEFFDLRFLYIKSMREAMKIEKNILGRNPRFIRCHKRVCITCSFRLY